MPKIPAKKDKGRKNVATRLRFFYENRLKGRESISSD